MATKEQVVQAVETTLGVCPRPSEFCHGEETDSEVARFELLLRSRTRATLVRQDLGSDPASDPVTFLTTEGFCYFMPNLVKMALAADEEQSYLYQFIMQLTPERIAALNVAQRRSVLGALEYARQEWNGPIAELIDRRIRRLQTASET